MPRHRTNPVTLLPLALCTAAAGLWVRSYATRESIGYVYPAARDHWFAVDSFRGSVWAGHASSRPEADGNPAAGVFRKAGGIPSVAGSGRTWHTFELQHTDPEGNERQQGIVVPHWFLMLLLLAPPAASRRRSRPPHRTANACGTCGYDLRATPEKCPECGGTTTVTTS